MPSRYLDVAILGTIEVRGSSGDPMPVPAGRPAMLLALLLTRRGGVVSADAAIEALWASRPPVHPENALQLAVSRLRRALDAGRGIPTPRRIREHDVVRVRAGDLSIELSPGAVDADRFETLAATGRAQLQRGEIPDAATTLRRALALWRGPALADVRDEGFARPEIGRLEELRLATLVDRIDADLATGQHARLVPELAALVDEHPLREKLRAQYMLALYGSGRQADALAAWALCCGRCLGTRNPAVPA